MTKTNPKFLDGKAPALDEPNFGKLDAVLDRATGAEKIVGAVVLVSEQGKLVYKRADGFADRESARRMTLRTPFRLSSVTKLFTISAALKLMASGQLRPADPVVRWLPTFTPSLTTGEKPEISVNDLLCHTAGLDYGFQQPPGGPYQQAGVSDGLDNTPITLAENIRRIASVPLDYSPSKWRYSVAIDVLGGVIESVSGLSLPEAIRELVTDPLGLKSATFHTTDTRLSTAYGDAKPAPRRMQPGTEVRLPDFVGAGQIKFYPDRIFNAKAFPAGGAGMAAEAHDVLTLLEALRAGPFIPEGLRSMMRAPQVGPEAQTNGPGWGFCWLGAILQDPILAESKLSKGSVAWGGVYGHSWFVDFDRGLVVVALTNTAVEGLFGEFPREVAEAVLV